MTPRRKGRFTSMPMPRRTVVLALLCLLVAVLAGCRTTDPRETTHVVSGESCESCHLGAWLASAFDHASVDFGRDCARCHTERDWHPTFVPDHDQSYPLREAHALIGCSACHGAGRADPQPTTCIGCHAADKARATPSHETFPDDCKACHNGRAWKPATFDHDARFPLTGKHVTTPCGNCHRNGVYAGTPELCVECHGDERPAEPDHTVLPEACQACHSTTAWKPAALDHDQFYPLLGQHELATCERCHTNGRYSGTPTACLGCHADDEAGAVNPNHTGYPNGCEECHDPALPAWRPATFEHDGVFPLTGKHATAECEGCHTNGRYEGTPTKCVDCHGDERPAEPDHTGLPATCEACHNTSAWRPAALDHDQFYPLRGGHANADCNGCHANGRYEGTPTACNACHADDKTRANGTVQGHAAFPNTCENCHTVAGWTPANFDHAAAFPLVGRHAQLDCDQCHAGGRYEGTPRDCIGCHAADKAGASPSHATYPDTCLTCHNRNQLTWDGATYTHRFPVPHRGVAACGQCHLDQSNYANFSCIDCHEHNRASMDAEHLGEVGGYQYNSQACYRCHSNGRADD